MIPTEPGYYWRFGLNHDNELIEQVVWVNVLTTWSDDLFYWEVGRVGAIFVHEEENVEWTGPIESGTGRTWDCPTCGTKVPSYLPFCPVNHLEMEHAEN